MNNFVMKRLCHLVLLISLASFLPCGYALGEPLVPPPPKKATPQEVTIRVIEQETKEIIFGAIVKCEQAKRAEMTGPTETVEKAVGLTSEEEF